MDAEERPDVTPLPEGFVLVDRALETTRPHPMRHRNGEEVEARLRQCSLYDPALDLAAETADGQVGGYALFWFDPVTQVGMVEPMRVEDEYQRRGLARAMLTAGLDRLALRGARRLKVSYATAAARSLYVGAGFRVTSTSTSYSLEETIGDRVRWLEATIPPWIRRRDSGPTRRPPRVIGAGRGRFRGGLGRCVPPLRLGGTTQ